MFSSKDLCKQQMNSHLYPILKRNWQITCQNNHIWNLRSTFSHTGIIFLAIILISTTLIWMMQPLFLNFLTNQYYFHLKVMFVINTDFMILLVLKMQLFQEICDLLNKKWRQSSNNNKSKINNRKQTSRHIHIAPSL